MRYILRCTPILVFLLFLSGCQSTRTSGDAAPDRTLLTREQIQEHGYRNAYDVVDALRSNWLRTRGIDSFRNPTEVQVYLNNSRMGGVETLRSIATQDVAYIQYYDGNEATARWGLDHGQGVIYVSTRPD